MRKWQFAAAVVAAIAALCQGAGVSCPQCDVANSILKPCNSALNIDSWSSPYVYHQISACLGCQTSSTANYTVMPLPEYKALCVYYNQPTFPFLPGGVVVATTTTPSQSTQPTSDPLPSEGNSGSGSSHSGLSSGAVAGVVVSAIALIVALSVAGYVYARRRREMARQKEEEDLYKFQENSRNSYMEAPLPQYTGMIQSSLPSLPQLTNLRVMNPDSDDEDNHGQMRPNKKSFEVQRGAPPGWRRGSFDDD
ncbi:hypothetical protein EC957_002623 [Mortierella hygrophila]|uniref:Uncharacterized protein n=1 Tax=Mortierella hygrophila TaxID=979708 RepID=A0A9P6F4Z1_9FUNG|nr:hypothetical protein EC957_002623 [Mortierella hygrophila]